MRSGGTVPTMVQRTDSTADGAAGDTAGAVTPLADRPRLPEAAVSSRAKLVVLYVQVYDGVTVPQLRRDLGLSELAVLTLVERLADRGVLRVDEGEVRMARELPA